MSLHKLVKALAVGLLVLLMSGQVTAVQNKVLRIATTTSTEKLRTA